MKAKHIISTLCLLSGSIFSMQAQSFFCTDTPRKMLTYGVRAGLNLSNVTVADGTFDRWNVNSWGMGMQVGAEVGIHFRDYFSVHPGFYFESRSGNYAYDMTVLKSVGFETQNSNLVQLGHYHSYHFTIPLMAQVSFNLSEQMRWNVGVGPYVSFRVGSGGSKEIMIPQEDALPPLVSWESKENPDKVSRVDMARRKGVNGGFKFSTGLQWRRHWSLDVAYMAACGEAWKNGRPGGRDKEWWFTLGYDF